MSNFYLHTCTWCMSMTDYGIGCMVAVCIFMTLTPSVFIRGRHQDTVHVHSTCACTCVYFGSSVCVCLCDKS